MTFLASFSWSIAIEHAIRFATRTGRRQRIVKIGHFWTITEIGDKA